MYVYVCIYIYIYIYILTIIITNPTYLKLDSAVMSPGWVWLCQIHALPNCFRLQGFLEGIYKGALLAV